MLVLNNTVDELDPVFHEYLIFCPSTAFVVICITEFAQASAGPTGIGPDAGGGFVLTYTVALPDVVPPVGQEAFPTALTAYVCVPAVAGVMFTLAGLERMVNVLSLIPL
jgi:hypothetical protein